MKGAPGFLLAVGLGLIGAVVNWLYLAQMARQLDHLDFVGIREEVKINPGDRFREEHFLRIPVPQHAVGGLQKAAVTWSAVDTVIGMPATKSYSAGEIVLWQDLKTPAVNDLLETLGPNDMAVGVPIDTRTVVVQNLNPGSSVSLIVPRQVLTPAGPAGTDRSALPEFIGPFEILALGTRKGQLQVLQSSGGAAVQEATMTVRVKNVEGKPEEKWRQLLEVMRNTNQAFGVVLHGREAPKPRPGEGRKAAADPRE